MRNVNNNLQFTDTLNVVALTVSGAAPTVTYTYNGPSGSQQMQAHYTSQNVQTRFGCNGIAEYSAKGQYLLTSLSFPDGSQYSFTYYGDGRIHTPTLRTGGMITYSYPGANGGISCTDGTMLRLNRTTPDSATAWTYTRSGTGNLTTTVVDPAANSTTITFSGGYETQRSQALQTINTAYTKLQNRIITQITKTRIYSNNLQSQTITKLDTFTDAYGLTQTHGLPTEIDEYDNGVGGPGPLLHQILFTYAALGNYIADRPATITIKNGSLQTVAQTTYTYDQYSLTGSGSPHLNTVSGSRGNATTVSNLVNPGTLNKSFTYYDNGLVNVATDINGATTTYHYGACGTSFATEVDMPLSLSQTMSWDCNGAVTTDTYDENQQHTHYDYDSLWRTVGITDPLSNLTTISYSNPPTLIETHLNNFNNNASTVDVFTTLDSLGRTHITQRRQSPGSGNYDSVESDYDSLGRVLHVTRPYVGTLGQSGGQSNESTTLYDSLDRATSVSWASGDGYTYTYTGNDVVSSLTPPPTGENSKERQFEFDGLGRLTSVCEVTATLPGRGTCGQNGNPTGYWTKYTYDPLAGCGKTRVDVVESVGNGIVYGLSGLNAVTCERGVTYTASRP